MEKIHITDKKIFFTSDLHFGHRNVIKFSNRPFADTQEMEEKLIKNWNDTITNEDIVFVLGDTFWFNDSHTIKKILEQLNGGKIYFIPGNHDDFEKYYRVFENDRYVFCKDIVVLFTKKLEIWLSHYPMMTWPHRVSKNCFQLFGHIHSKEGVTEGVDQDLPLHKNQFDVGCDYWDYKPVSLDRVLNLQGENLQVS